MTFLINNRDIQKGCLEVLCGLKNNFVFCYATFHLKNDDYKLWKSLIDMKKTSLLIFVLFVAISTNGQISLKAPGVKWDAIYSFDRCNEFKMEAYAKNNELMRTFHLKTYYKTDGENFVVKTITEIKGNGMETILDKSNQVAIQIFGSGGGAKPYYNAGAFKYPQEDEIKRLEIVPTSDTRVISGLPCKRYTYTYKKIFGEVWITDEVKLKNDVGVFRACKMQALHNTLSAEGFVMEMTTEDAKGGRTLMTTVSLQNNEKYTIDLSGVEMNTAINKVNYFTF